MTVQIIELLARNVYFLLTGCKTEQQMMYAGSKNELVKTAELTKVNISQF